MDNQDDQANPDNQANQANQGHPEDQGNQVNRNNQEHQYSQGHQDSQVLQDSRDNQDSLDSLESQVNQLDLVSHTQVQESNYLANHSQGNQVQADPILCIRIPEPQRHSIIQAHSIRTSLNSILRGTSALSCADSVASLTR